MATNSMSIGVPIKILHEAEGHIVTVETKSGEVFRGKLLEAEDNMNCQMANVEVTYRGGNTRNMELVCLRGSKIRFFILPDMLKNAPMLKKLVLDCVVVEDQQSFEDSRFEDEQEERKEVDALVVVLKKTLEVGVRVEEVEEAPIN